VSTRFDGRILLLAIPAVKEKLIRRIKNTYAAAKFAGYISPCLETVDFSATLLRQLRTGLKYGQSTNKLRTIEEGSKAFLARKRHQRNDLGFWTPTYEPEGWEFESPRARHFLWVRPGDMGDSSYLRHG
jgi:hypothetical protein